MNQKMAKKAIGIGVGLLIILALYLSWSRNGVDPTNIYEVERPTTRNISQSIFASGSLQVAGLIKVGSLVTGTMDKILVSENQFVKEGQLLGIINNGKGDTDVREAEALYRSRQAETKFRELELAREKALKNEAFASESSLDDAERAYRVAADNAKAALAQLERSSIDYGNIQIKAPASGIITAVGISKGERVVIDLDASVLFQIAPDVKKMEAKLDIDERDIGQIQVGQPVKMVVDTYPYRVFKSTVANVSFSPQEKQGPLFYKSLAYIDNPNLLLRPGMTVTATIDVASVENALTITSRPFLIDSEDLSPAAEALGYELQPLNPTLKQSFLEDETTDTKFVWVLRGEEFVEVPVKIGVNDNIYFEVKSGLTDEDLIISDVLEKDVMEELYKKFTRKGL